MCKRDAVMSDSSYSENDVGSFAFKSSRNPSNRSFSICNSYPNSNHYRLLLPRNASKPVGSARFVDRKHTPEPSAHSTQPC
jgi:hypothetical protein